MREVVLIVKLNRLDEVRAVLGSDPSRRLVRELQDVVRASCRGSDSICRHHDDTCLAIVPVEDTQTGVALAERIRRRVAAHVFDAGNGVELSITCSIGFSPYPFVDTNPDLETWRQAVALARLALTAAEARSDDAWAGFVAIDRADLPSTPLDGTLDDPERLVHEGRLAPRASRTDIDALLRSHAPRDDSGGQPAC
jgi:GGDEF domain-containing protein